MNVRHRDLRSPTCLKFVSEQIRKEILLVYVLRHQGSKVVFGTKLVDGVVHAVETQQSIKVEVLLTVHTS
jgi:hypothetical protein